MKLNKKKEKSLKNIIPLKNILLRFMKLILIFINIMKKKHKLIKMGVNIYYLQLMFFLNKFLLAVEIDEKGHTDRDLIFEILCL